MTPYPHEHTIGTIHHEGSTYEIDWPFELDDDSKRSPDFAAIFRAGKEIACLEPQGWGAAFETFDDVMEAAWEAIMSGEIDD